MTYNRIYVCSPLRADNKPSIYRNALKAQQYMEIVRDKYNCRTFAPHAYLPYLLDDDNPEERDLALEFGLKLLALCDALIICGNVITKGMKGEIEKANEFGIPILCLDDKDRFDISISLTFDSVGGR